MADEGADPLRIGGASRFGRYRLVEELGRGGMAVVYRAVLEGPRGFSRTVVVKRILGEAASDPRFVGLLATEARVAGLLHHPGIVEVHEFGEVDGEVYLAMELVEGVDLARLLARGRERSRSMGPGVACFIAAEVAGALAYAHALRDETGRPLEIVHRDVSPSNLVVTPHGGVKLLDFGIARAAAHLRDEQTRTGVLKGKVAYMSPEQAEGLPVDARSDLFSLGVVLHECLTGERPFRGESVLEVLRRIREARVEPPSRTVPDLDPEVDEVVLRLLTRAPEDRYPDGDEVAAVLRRIARRHDPAGDGLQRLYRELGPFEIARPIQPRVPSGTARLERPAAAAAGGENAGEEPRPSTTPHRSAPSWWTRVPGLAGAGSDATRRLPWLGAAALVLVLLGGAGWLLARRREAGHGPEPARPAATARARRAVAILGPRNLTGRADATWIATALQEMLGSELGAGDKLRILPGESLDRAGIEPAAARADGLAPDTLGRLRAGLGADLVVLGAYSTAGAPPEPRLRLDLRLQDAASGEVLAVAAETGREADLGELAARAGARLRARLGLDALAGGDQEPARAALPRDPVAARRYAEGLERLRRAQPLAARDLLQQAVAVEPGHALAHSALGMAWALLGHDGKALEEARRAFEVSSGLPRADRLLVEGRYREAAREWDKAIAIHGALRTFYPDDIEHGLRLAAAQISSGRTDAALATLSILRALPPPDGADPRIDLAEANAASVAGDHRRSLAAAREATRRAEEQDAPLLVARGRHWEGWAQRNLGELAGAARAYQAGLGVYRALGHRMGEAEALNDLAILRRDQGDLDGARPMYAEALAIHRELGRDKGVAQALNNLAEVSRLQGDLDGARRAWEEALGLARALGDRFGEALVLGNLGELLAARGEVGAAGRVYGEALAAARALGQRSLVGYLLHDLGELRADEGDLAAARRAYQEAHALRVELGEKGTAAESELALARIDLAEGRTEEARARAVHALDELHREQAPGEAVARATLAGVLLAAGKPAEARAAAAEAEALVAAGKDPTRRIDAVLAAAPVRAAAGGAVERTGAVEALRAAGAEAARLGLSSRALAARLAVAEIDLLAGGRAADRSSARGRLAAVESEAHARGLGLLARRAAAARRR